MATFLTGVTGFLGSYVAAALLRAGETLHVLLRADGDADVERRLWRALQLHFDAREFRERRDRIHAFRGDLTAPGLGLAPADVDRITRTADSFIHCAASLRRTSERACLNVNLRGTLAVLRLAQATRDRGGLRRFSHVSTVSVAGERHNETVHEDTAIDWERRDYDAYARTKKFAELLVRELLDDVPITIFRPSIVLGDSRRPETTQFDMARAFSFLASLPVLPLRAAGRIDIVPVNWVAEAVVRLHRAERPRHETYHLSAGTTSPTYAALTAVLADAFGRRRPTFLPLLERPFGGAARLVGSLGRGPIPRGAKLLDVFFPYLVYDTVFDHTRAVEELGSAPASFPDYCVELLRFVRANGFRYPYVDEPPTAAATDTAARTPPTRVAP